MVKPDRGFWLLVLALPILISSCWSYEEVELKSVDGIMLVGLSPSSLSLEVSATISNPNKYKIKVKDPDIDLYLEGNKVGKLQMDAPLTLEKDTVMLYVVPIHTELDGALASVFPVLLGVMSSNSIRFGAKGSFTGSAKMISKRIDVDIDQQVDLSR